MKKSKLVKITWKDAIIYDNHEKGRGPDQMETTGYLIEKNKSFVILKNTKTRLQNSKKNEYEEHQYSYIPQGMIVEIKNKKR